MTCSSSFLLNPFGFTTTPPFDPPKGIFTTAHLSAIKKERSLTWSRVKSGWNLMPPLHMIMFNSFSQTYPWAHRKRDRPSHQANLQKQSPDWPWEGLQLQGRIYSRILCIDIFSFPHRISCNTTMNTKNDIYMFPF